MVLNFVVSSQSWYCFAYSIGCVCIYWVVIYVYIYLYLIPVIILIVCIKKTKKHKNNINSFLFFFSFSLKKKFFTKSAFFSFGHRYIFSYYCNYSCYVLLSIVGVSLSACLRHLLPCDVYQLCQIESQKLT